MHSVKVKARRMNATTLLRSYKLYSIFTNPVIRSVLLFIFEIPLLTLYLEGPRFYGIGFYQGMTRPAICSELTMVGEEHWRLHEDVCNQLIGQHFESFVIAFYFLIYTILLLSFCIRTCCYTQWLCCCRRKRTDPKPKPPSLDLA